MLLQINSFSDDTRERIHEIAPFLPSSFVTWLTAKPRAGENVQRQTSSKALASTGLTLIAGLAIGFSAGDNLNPLVIPVSQVCVLSSLRMLRLTVQHGCSHDAVFTNPRWNQALGTFISILTLTTPFQEYKERHCKIHHSKQLFRPGDETHEFLFKKAGFRPSMSADEAWQHLWTLIFSPTFHYRQFGARLKSTFFSPDPTHNLLAFSFWLSILGVVTLTDSWATFFWVWIVPISVLFEISSLLRQCVEHKFGNTPSEMTSAIFCGEEPPTFNASDPTWIVVWGETRWFLRMFFYHLPVRLLILTGDSPVHDYHHKRPGSDWVNAHLDRQAEVEAGVSYSHSWGLLEAINKTFESFSQMPPD